MSAFNDKTFLGKHQAISIAAIFLLISGIWIYVSNYLLFGQFPIFQIETIAEIEAISDGVVVLATAVLIYILVKRSIFALEKSQLALKDQTERLQVLSRKLLDVQERERRAIARELHDEIGQALTGLKLSLEMIDRISPEPAREKLNGAVSLINDLMGRVRNLSLDLRPAALDDLGLLPALLWHFERYSKQTGIQVDFKHQKLEERRLERDVETVACRIIQEALTNVARHAHTKLVEVRVWIDEVSLSLRVEDHGAGFETHNSAGASSSGLIGMEERASMVGGTLVIDSLVGRGTNVSAELPLLLGQTASKHGN
jgi:signal transduction histidine kinase